MNTYMCDQPNGSRYSRKAILLLAVLIGAAFAGNFFAPRLFTGFTFLFGSIAVLLVVRLYGIRWGLLVGLIASSGTIALFGQPYTVTWLCAEPLVVGWLLSRNRSGSIILYDALYWPLVGAPLLWICCHYLMGLSLPLTLAALMMFWISGMSNAIIASLLLTHVPLLTRIVEPETARLTPLNQLIFNLMMALVLLPVITITIIHARDTESRNPDATVNGLEKPALAAAGHGQLRENHNKALLILLCTNMLTLATALFVSRRLAAPLRRLSQMTIDLPERLLGEKVTSWPESSISEIARLRDNFRRMCAAFSHTSLEFASARDTLEQRVNDRTRELSDANRELLREISEHKLTERQRDHLMEELVTQLRFLQTLIDAIPNPIFYKDNLGRYQGCNRAFEESWGLSRQEITGKTVHQLFPAEAADLFQKADQELFQQRGIQIYETRKRFANGQDHDITFYKATYDDMLGNLGGLVGTIVDITEQKKAEAERDRLMLELRQKNKDLEGIIYVASHDLRSPLVNVQGFSRKLASNCSELNSLTAALTLTTEARHSLDTLLLESIPKSLGYVITSIEKMDGLLSGLLRLSRLGRAALCFETLDMRLILGKILSSLAFQIESAGAQIELGQLEPCWADDMQVTQIFSNLLDNAIKYRSTERKLRVRVNSEIFGDGIRYCVEDNGIGIPRDQQENIWNLFCRLNPDVVQGEGLGLTTARRIADRLGGSIWVESEAGAGSRFIVSLPRTRPEFLT